MTVSIQLVAPASGAFTLEYCYPGEKVEFPFNWLPQRVGPPMFQGGSINNVSGFHSIGCPSEWGHDTQGLVIEGLTLFPFNWLPQRVGPRFVCNRRRRIEHVSIQLVAPASGAPRLSPLSPRLNPSFHSIGCPSEWGPRLSNSINLRSCSVSIQLVAPASGAAAS